MNEKLTSILVVDDEPKICNILSDILTFKGYKVLKAFGGRDALRVIEREKVDLVLLDLMMPDMSGKEVLHYILENIPEVPAIMISAHGTIKTAVESIKTGAYDFIEKPLDADRVLITVKNALEKRMLSLKTELLEKDICSRYEMIGESTAMMKVFELIELYAPSNVSVLITGESGTGKELVAHALHNLSRRVGLPMIKINCAAIPEHLVESELFGFEKGAFSGAVQSKKGKIELAHGGTLFLDEIGDLRSGTQAKLLRLLEQQEFERLGGLKTIKVDFRLITATNQDLSERVEKGLFREDLFYRLDVARIHLPPLRKRKSDIPLLANAFFKEFCEENNLDCSTVDSSWNDDLDKHDWPGNVRELKNYIHKVIIFSQGDNNYREVEKNLQQERRIETGSVEDQSLKAACNEFEKEFIVSMLKKHKGNITQTAKSLKIDRSNLHKKMKQLGI